jgi:hypothetical protein
MALTPDEKKMLKVVLQVAGDMESMVREGIITALRGENDKGRRNYLWHTLQTAALAKIRRARKKYAR